MKLELIGTLTNLSVDHEDSDYWDKFSDFLDKFGEMKEKSDLAVAVLEDGEELLLAAQNFNLGQCDCCGNDRKNEIVRFDFYSRVKDE